MTGMFDGLAQLLYLSVFMLLVLPVAVVLLVKQLKILSSIPCIKRYVLYFVTYIFALLLTFLAIRLVNRMWQLQVFAVAGIAATTFLMLSLIPGNNKQQ